MSTEESKDSNEGKKTESAVVRAPESYLNARRIPFNEAAQLEEAAAGKSLTLAFKLLETPIDRLGDA